MDLSFRHLTAPTLSREEEIPSGLDAWASRYACRLLSGDAASRQSFVPSRLRQAEFPDVFDTAPARVELKGMPSIGLSY